ncbi:MAG: YgiQ family radical SAM protein [Candidatus Firestonebacteria bacterium RIFOXYC2_FULL_39_67]|nr:MAG: YgiQ family radical SAM protein [Candidatus Firestonebacteria bacterium RIFOXYD2_FULL_39_29]OGF51885.1 MAG: YgiQ family radical SAM protein [Candidatus Firestonebacteria bacterium RifOxyC12_full_39_7]OGF55496.1 MAG: YgiQ family radical SAM protein [Candidatus Firestonebacteria bacterium RIFOXYC2_FULL_39_67]
MFIPTTADEVKRIGWKTLDIILITGDAYIDSSFIGVAVIGKVLMNAGFRVGIIAQPDLTSILDITRLGEPELFWGVTAGAVDSMVANYTALLRKRLEDDFTPGVENNKRPERAVIAYTNLIKRNFKKTKPIILGGLEASLRRIAHYDYFTDSIRRSVLFDAKADILVYGMGEKAVLEIAAALKEGKDCKNIKGICYASSEAKPDYIEVASYDEVKTDKKKFAEMFKIFYDNTDPVTAKGLLQKHDTRYLVQNPPQPNLTTPELDAIYDLDYEREVHPYYKQKGEVRAMETIKYSITSHRGCYGECNFCSLAVHQGTTVVSRSSESIIREAENISGRANFKGFITDVGGPTANMYGIECKKKLKEGRCKDRRCIYPEICPKLNISHLPQMELLRKIAAIPGVKKVFIASGLRYDMIINDREFGLEYLEELVKDHVSGQLKIAPEHITEKVTALMGKTKLAHLRKFREQFDGFNLKHKKNQFLTYYMIAAHPGCELTDMKELRAFVRKELKMTPEQIQVFTPAPSTYSTLMYHTGYDPFTGKAIFVEKGLKGKREQRDVIFEPVEEKGYKGHRIQTGD